MKQNVFCYKDKKQIIHLKFHWQHSILISSVAYWDLRYQTPTESLKIFHKYNYLHQRVRAKVVEYFCQKQIGANIWHIFKERKYIYSLIHKSF